MQGWLRHLGKADPSRASKGFPKRAIQGCGQHCCNLPGYGCATSRNQRWRVGSTSASGATAGRLRKSTIVALARKLLVALWKYVAAGVVIDGAVVRAA